MRALINLLLFAGWYFVSMNAIAELEYDDDEIDLSYKNEKFQVDDRDAEIDWSTPVWPLTDKLIPVDVGRINFPFSLMIDPDSLKVNKGRLIQYTVVLRSKGGVDNVSFEAIRCSRGQYKRVAYGSGGEFHVIGQPTWKFYSDSGVDRYRQLLANKFFCSLNSFNPETEIIEKLKSENAHSSSFLDDD